MKRWSESGLAIPPTLVKATPLLLTRNEYCLFVPLYERRRYPGLNKFVPRSILVITSALPWVCLQDSIDKRPPASTRAAT